jgi:sugar phosphate isomerase/epimerase
MNWLTLEGLEEPPDGWLRAIRDAGYEGVQFIEPLPATVAENALAMGLRVCGSGRVNIPEDAERLAAEARRHVDRREGGV